MQKYVFMQTEQKPIPLKSGMTFHTLFAPNFEYCEIVNSKKNNGTPKKNNITKNAITNAPF